MITLNVYNEKCSNLSIKILKGLPSTRLFYKNTVDVLINTLFGNDIFKCLLINTRSILIFKLSKTY